MFNGKKHLLITYFQFRRILEGFGIEKLVPRAGFEPAEYQIFSLAPSQARRPRLS